MSAAKVEEDWGWRLLKGESITFIGDQQQQTMISVEYKQEQGPLKYLLYGGRQATTDRVVYLACHLFSC